MSKQKGGVKAASTNEVWNEEMTQKIYIMVHIHMEHF